MFYHYSLGDGYCLVVFTEFLVDRQDTLVLLCLVQQGRISAMLEDLGGISRLEHKVHKDRYGCLTSTFIQREREREREISVIYRLTFSLGPHNTCLLEIICLSVHKVEGHARKVFISCVLNGSIVI